MHRAQHPNLEYEFKAGYPKLGIAGADEVGRGCLVGPVVAAAVILPKDIDFKKLSWIGEIHDSKKLTAEVRSKLAPLILNWAVATAIGMASVQEIDQINIFHASHLAITRAIQKLSVVPDHILIDGKFLPQQGLPAPATAIVQGDAQSLSIAAASILAKVWRDQAMVELDQRLPQYGFAQHKGYPTPAHQVALKKHGVTEFHRRSFRTVFDLAPDKI